MALREIGSRIWRLRRLSPADGEILDVPGVCGPGAIARASRPARVCEEEQAPTVTVEAEPTAETSAPALRHCCRTSQWRVICFGGFKQMLAPR
jgi:hypothetical protein